MYSLNRDMGLQAWATRRFSTMRRKRDLLKPPRCAPKSKKLVRWATGGGRRPRNGTLLLLAGVPELATRATRKDERRKEKLVRLCGPQQYVKHLRDIEHFQKREMYRGIRNLDICWSSRKLKVWKFRKHVFVICVQIKGWSAFFRIEGTKLVCAISRKLVCSWKAHLFSIRGP